MVSRARWWAGPWSERWPLAYPRPRWHRQPPPSLVHHSDRGVQYESHEYVQAIRTPDDSEHEPGREPYDNASCEELYEDAQARRDLRQRLCGSRSLAQEHRSLHRRLL